MEDKTLNDLGLHELEGKETNVISGGDWIEFTGGVLKKLTPAAFAIWVVENWDEVKQGVSDGWYVR